MAGQLGRNAARRLRHRGAPRRRRALARARPVPRPLPALCVAADRPQRAPGARAARPALGARPRHPARRLRAPSLGARPRGSRWGRPRRDRRPPARRLPAGRAGPGDRDPAPARGPGGGEGWRPPGADLRRLAGPLPAGDPARRLVAARQRPARRLPLPGRRAEGAPPGGPAADLDPPATRWSTRSRARACRSTPPWPRA